MAASSKRETSGTSLKKPMSDEKKCNSKSAASSPSSDLENHPVLTVINKKIRSLKKKLDKVESYEAASNQGKVLNPQQIEVIQNKPNIVKLYNEYDNLRDQLVEALIESSSTSTTSTTEEQTVAKEEQTVAKEEPTKEEPVLEKVVSEESSTTTTNATTTTPHDVEAILRLVHIVTRYQALGKDVPSVVDFFVKSVLGQTRPVAEVEFQENLEESLQAAKLYLSSSDQVVACDMTYKQLSAFVDELLAQESAAKEEELSVPASPEINFFTDSHLSDTEETTAVAVAPATSVEPVVESPKKKNSQKSKSSRRNKNPRRNNTE